MRKILVVSPHPDDEIIGCGGTILKNIHAGNEVFVAHLTYYGTKVREAEARRVQRASGINKLFFLNLPEPLEVTQDNLRRLIGIIREVSPDMVFFPHELDGDRDHRKAYELTREALWMSKTDLFKGKRAPLRRRVSSLTYEVHSPMDGINYYEDISDFMTQKLELLRMYKSQVGFRDYPGAVEGLNKFRGVMGANCRYAEAFQIKKWSGTL